MSSCSGPKPLFQWDSESTQVPALVDFNNQTEEADSFLWTFGDGVMSRDSSPSHKYLLSGRYTTSLTAFKGGKSNTIQKDLVLFPPDRCLVEIETSHGSMLVELNEATPQHRDNFLKLAEEGYYEGLLFHRVISGFMIQGGDPNSKNADQNTRLGTGGPGYTIDAEIIDSLIHVKGALAAARRGDAVNPERRSSGSQFYIVQGQTLKKEQLEQITRRTGKIYSPNQIKAYSDSGGTPFLDTQYTVFGMVIDGIEVIDAIAGVETDGSDRPIENVQIKNVRVIK